MNKKIHAGLIVLVLGSLACTLPSIPTVGTTPDTDTSVDNMLLFQDDFSETNSGWDQVEDSDAYTGYDNSMYRISILVPSYSVWATPGQSFQNDVSISVNATMTSGPVDNAFGIICRHQDVDNFYIFVISSDGYAGIGRRVAGGDIELISGETMIVSDAINQGVNISNAIQADCISNSFSLFVNSTMILTASDDSISIGDVGLVASSFSEGGVDISFDNFAVYRP